MITTTPMGPGFFIFFQTETIESGGWFDYGTIGERFVPKSKEEEEAAPIIEKLVMQVEETPVIETKQDIELILRLKLKKEELTYKKRYLEWIMQEIKVKRRKRAAIVLLLH